MKAKTNLKAGAECPDIPGKVNTKAIIDEDGSLICEYKTPPPRT